MLAPGWVNHIARRLHVRLDGKPIGTRWLVLWDPQFDDVTLANMGKGNADKLLHRYPDRVVGVYTPEVPVAVLLADLRATVEALA